MKDEKILCPYCREDVPMEMAMSGTHMRCPRCHSTSPLIRDLHTAALTPEDVVRHVAMSRHREAVKDGDLISRAAFDEVLDQFERLKAHAAFTEGIMVARRKLASAPAVGAEPVRHGRWIPLWRNLFGLKGFKCSECGHVEKSYGWVYCHCGAKMDLEAEG